MRVARGSPLRPPVEPVPVGPLTTAASWRRTVSSPSIAGSPRRRSSRWAAAAPWAGSGELTTSSTTPRWR
jgi:hypothetical protein